MITLAPFRLSREEQALRQASRIPGLAAVGTLARIAHRTRVWELMGACAQLCPRNRARELWRDCLTLQDEHWVDASLLPRLCLAFGHFYTADTDSPVRTAVVGYILQISAWYSIALVACVTSSWLLSDE